MQDILALFKAKPKALFILGRSLMCLIVVGCTQGEVAETNGYVSRDQFYKGMGWAYALPNDAQKIRARWELRGTQDNTVYIRFDTNVADFSTTLEEWSRTRSFSRDVTRVTAPLPITSGDYDAISMKLIWWQPRKIQNGYYVNIPDPAGHGLRIWVDKGESVVYVCDEG